MREGKEAHAATCPFRKSYPNVMVVQPRQDWDGYNDPAPLHCRGASLPTAKCVRTSL